MRENLREQQRAREATEDFTEDLKRIRGGQGGMSDRGKLPSCVSVCVLQSNMVCNCYLVAAAAWAARNIGQACRCLVCEVNSSTVLSKL